MKYLKTYELLNKLDTSDNPIFIEFMISFITSLDYNLTTNYNIKYGINEICFYKKLLSNMVSLQFTIEILEDELFIKIYGNEFKFIEEYLETIYGLDLIGFEHHIYNFEIKGNIQDIMKQITKEYFYFKRQANKFNI